MTLPASRLLRCAGILLVAYLFLAARPFTYGASSDQYHRNWPHWRGPAANGLVLHGRPPLTWSETENVKWKVAVPGSGHATPIIWENRLFLLTAESTDDSERPLRFVVLCLDRSDGRTLWRRVVREDAPHQEIQQSNTHASASPVTDGEVLIASFGSFGLYAFDLEGTVWWQQDPGQVQVTYGEGSSPAIAGEVVLLVQDNNDASFIHAFDRQTGRERWKKQREEGTNWTTPFVLERDGRTEVIVSGSTAIRSYDPLTGDVLWQCGGLGRNAIPMVVTDETTVYAMSGQRTSPMAMAIRLGGSGDLTDSDAIRWRLTRGTPYVSSPLLYGGNLYFFQHINALLTCVDARTGTPHYSQERLDGLTSVYASPVGANDRIYLVGREGTTLVIEKSSQLKVLARNALDDQFDASPAVVGSELFLRGHRHLYCLAEERADGAQ